MNAPINGKYQEARSRLTIKPANTFVHFVYDEMTSRRQLD